MSKRINIPKITYWCTSCGTAVNQREDKGRPAKCPRCKRDTLGDVPPYAPLTSFEKEFRNE